MSALRTSTRDVSDQLGYQSVMNKERVLERPATVFRHFVEKGGKFEPEAGRYHLYVSYACRESGQSFCGHWSLNGVRVCYCSMGT